MRLRGIGLLGGLMFALVVLGAAQAQVGFDRLGGDYADFPVRSADPAQCATRCERDQRCRAWAFSYPVTENAAAICWLKSRVTPRVPATCCVSGLSQLRDRPRPERQGLRGGLHDRDPMPGLDLRPAGLQRGIGGVLSQGSCDEPAA
jgi:hypothetical protein